jgi:hypothetical protein
VDNKPPGGSGFSPNPDAGRPFPKPFLKKPRMKANLAIFAVNSSLFTLLFSLISLLDLRPLKKCVKTEITID